VLADPAVRGVFLGTEVTAALAGGSLEPAPPGGDRGPSPPVQGDDAAGGERGGP
jgi:hypothetical protein